MPYRILSLDGGGIRGVFTATLLAKLEERVPGLLARVDLFAGTSTGGILALGLAAGLPPAELARLYLERGADIFPDPHLDGLAFAARLVSAGYDNRNLERILEDTCARLGVATLGDLPRSVLVPTFDLDSAAHPGRPGAPRTWKPKFFHNFETNGDRDARIVDVAMRTAAGPTYFPTYQGYADGGVIANNPSMAALAQAVNPATGGRRVEDVCVLSLGTGQRFRHVAGPTHDWGFVQWAGPLLQILIEGAMDTARYECEQLLPGRFLRLDVPLEKDMGLDDVANAADLAERARTFELDRKTTDWLETWFGPAPGGAATR